MQICFISPAFIRRKQSYCSRRTPSIRAGGKSFFVRQPNEHLAIWEGHKLTKEQATAISGIKNVKWLTEFQIVFRSLICEMENVYLNSNEHQRADVTVETRDIRFVRACRKKFPLHQYHRLAPLMHELRSVKSSYEIDAIKAACDLTGKGFKRVCKF